MKPIIRHSFGITAAIAFVVACTILPFLPGRYDTLAVPLSIMAQVSGIIGLALAPVGALWMTSEHSSRLRPMRYPFAITALIAVSVFCVLLSFVALTESLILAAITLGIGALAALKLFGRVRSMRAVRSGPSVIPAYLIVVPIAVFLSQRSLAESVSEFSRSRGIDNSAALIADIEAHRVANGRYPLSTISVHPDYKPSIIGVREYRYEPSGDSYNVLFELPTFRLGTQEIVMYNPRDAQAIASHALDVLQLTPAQLALDRTRGHYAVRDAGRPHWKYFLFD